METHQYVKLDSVTELRLKRWMKAALAEAERGTENGEHPFGAAIYTPEGEQLSVACNTVCSTNNPAAHAEVNAIAAACQAIGEPSLTNHWLVATAEPCPMCLSTAAIAGIKFIAFGASQAVVNEAGYGGLGVTGRDLARQMSANIHLRSSILANDCVSFLLRNRKRNR
ncbi:nucleoside deaminase [Rubripirellula amarantea]|nr:nucleoside deaminase [Rubripirellula amarantea]